MSVPFPKHRIETEGEYVYAAVEIAPGRTLTYRLDQSLENIVLDVRREMAKRAWREHFGVLAEIAP